MAKQFSGRYLLLILTTAALVVACQGEDVSPSAEGLVEDLADGLTGRQGNSAASELTARLNRAVGTQLPIEDPKDFEDARRGLIAQAQSLVVRSPDGQPIWNMPAYDFLEADAPASVNPSLWRQARLNNVAGLFKVTDGLYQLRGFDLSNMSLIAGKKGWIVVDPLTTKETAAAALAFAQKHLGVRPISAVILTHSHVDHFGGVASVLEQDGSTEVIAPVGFTAAAASENILAGLTMARRSMFMYGSQLDRSPKGHIDSGLGKAPALGSVGIAKPTRSIRETGEQITIDGVEFIFQNAENSEAPAELTFYLPEHGAFCGAELVSRTMHNLYTLRGAQVRDALSWSQHIDDALHLFGNADVYFASHHWPLWGNAEIVDFLKKQRDGYRYIHDQTLRLASQGYTPNEIAEELELPESLKNSFSNRGYYGTLKHNAKAVYQRYFGWYDANPANLDPLPATEAAERYVSAMGGAESVMAIAQEAYEEGEYRWVAQLLNHLVFAAPDDLSAKALLAKAYDQLGYQAESGPWRDVYLTAALELRRGPPAEGISPTNAVDLLRAAPISEFMQLIATMLDGPRADGERFTFNFVFTDVDETYVLDLENSVLHSRLGAPAANANATLRLTHELFIQLITGRAGVKDTVFSDAVGLDGSAIDLLRFFALLEPADEVFNIVTP